MRNKGHRKSNFVKIITAVAVAVVAILYVFDVFIGDAPNSAISECEIHFIDVGQGDCSMFITESSAVVIDTGTASAAGDTEKYIKSYTDEIDYLVLTHPHEDHIGGAVQIIENINVKNIVLSDAASDTATFSNLLGAMDKSGANIICGRAGDTFSAGGMDINVLAPLGEFDDFNYYSIVVRIDYGVTSVLVTGDAEKQSESLMCKRWGAELRADVLKLGHHGSSTSSSREFISAVSPAWAVISCGRNNSYGHPHAATIDLLEECNIPYVRTDETGSIVFHSDGKKIALVGEDQ